MAGFVQPSNSKIEAPGVSRHEKVILPIAKRDYRVGKADVWARSKACGAMSTGESSEDFGPLCLKNISKLMIALVFIAERSICRGQADLWGPVEICGD
jgi:hypothetical protein